MNLGNIGMGSLVPPVDSMGGLASNDNVLGGLADAAGDAIGFGLGDIGFANGGEVNAAKADTRLESERREFSKAFADIAAKA